MTEPRDESFDHLLRQTLRQTPDAGATSSCLDAETMAAWMDGGLSGAALAAAEMHVATCPRCLALVAATVRSEPADERPIQAPLLAPQPLRAPSRSAARRAWPWLVPLAAAAVVALAIWIPQRGDQPRQESTIASAPAVETAPPPPVETAPPPSTSVSERAPQLEAARPSSSSTLETAQAKQNRETARETRAEATVAAPPVNQAADALTRSRADAPPAVAPPPAVPSPGVPSSTAATARPVAPPPASLGQVITAVPVVAFEFSSSDPLLRQALATGASAFAAGGNASTPAPGPAGRGGAGGGGRGGAGGGRAAAGRGGAPSTGAVAGGGAPPAGSGAGLGPAAQDLSTSATVVRWRVLASGVVERSTNAGILWEPVTTQAPGVIVNGTAPGPNVCWLVGRGGLVLRTTDARTFTRLPFPVATDLASVRAVSALEATATTTDGRTFSTADGGQTWN